jgi:Flp pilus assembly pilin Flp
MRNLMLRAAVKLQSHKAREEGQTVIEYALVVAVVSIGLIIAIGLFGQDLVTGASEALADYIP